MNDDLLQVTIYAHGKQEYVYHVNDVSIGSSGALLLRRLDDTFNLAVFAAGSWDRYEFTLMEEEENIKEKKETLTAFD